MLAWLIILTILIAVLIGTLTYTHIEQSRISSKLDETNSYLEDTSYTAAAAILGYKFIPDQNDPNKFNLQDETNTIINDPTSVGKRIEALNKYFDTLDSNQFTNTDNVDLSIKKLLARLKKH
jgi:hypothetical protein